jgi:hypothetical protein
MLQPPDNQHEWRFDATRREWFYLVNGNSRVYQNSTPRVLRPTGPGQQFQIANASLASGYQVASGPSTAIGGTPPISIRSGPTAQSGGRPIASPNFAGSPQPVTGFSPTSLGDGRFLSQNPPSGPSFGGASPPANLPLISVGRGGGFPPPANASRTGAGRGGYAPPVNPPPKGSGRSGGYIPPAGGPQPGPSAIIQATGGSSQLTEVQKKQILDAG